MRPITALCLALPLLALSVPATARTSAPKASIEAAKDSTKLRVTALTDNILRVQISRDGRWPEDASWAIAKTERGKRAKVTTSADGFSTTAVNVAIDPATLRLTVTDKAGKVITADAASPIGGDGKGFALRKAIPINERFFGLGDKTGSLDRRASTYVSWNTDAYGFNDTTDPIYKSIPFFISNGGAGGAYGIFLDNSWRTYFDFGHKDAGTLEMGAPDGPIDYYIIAGPTIADVVRRYTDLTGKAPLPPRWSLGYQQSRYSYMSDAEVREIAARLRADKVPTDVIWLDIDYQDRNRPFTTNAKTFPDMKKLAGDMNKDGIKLVAITDLHIAAAPDQGYAPYDLGTAGNHFVRNGKGETYVAPVWPGASVFPDFTRSASRAYWGGLYKGLVDDGIAGFWNDMNEPAIFETPTKTMPEDNLHRIDTDDFAPRDATHAEVHNVYGMENTRATFEGLKKLRPGERPFVMTRASYAGGQKYAVTWTGDNNATWDHLKLSVAQLLNLGLSGFSYSAADVGGFTGGPSPELLTRWMQIAAFTPVFRVHAANNTPRSEPWVDGPEHLALRRKAIEERYRLMPYIYQVAEQNARTGDPIMRPIFYDYPEMSSAFCDQAMTFTLGKSLLIAGASKPESPQAYDVCLPKGGWYDYWNGTKAEAPKETSFEKFDVVKEKPSIERLPVFVRAGTILPRQPLTQSLSETPSGPLSLDIYPGEDCTGELYADDGLTDANERGVFLRQTISCTMGKDGMQIDFSAREGSYKPWWSELTITVHGMSGPAGVSVNGKKLKAVDKGVLSFTLPDQAKASRVIVSKSTR